LQLEKARFAPHEFTFLTGFLVGQRVNCLATLLAAMNNVTQ
jgi:hypothetical protein